METLFGEKHDDVKKVLGKITVRGCKTLTIKFSKIRKRLHETNFGRENKYLKSWCRKTKKSCYSRQKKLEKSVLKVKAVVLFSVSQVKFNKQC